MPSPFPGMDPYLEVNPFWADFHSTMITAMKSAIRQRLPSGYTVWSDIYIWLHEPDADTRKGKPDLFVAGKPQQGNSASVAVLSPPATSILPAVRREGNKYLRIHEVGSDRVITAIELLSPANKAPGEMREAYLAKRNEYLATETNLVEIDLHRTGLRMPLGDPTPPNSDYYVLLCRAVDFPKTAIWPFSVRDVLPEIPVPLKPEHGHVTLPLQDCYNWTYDQGPYESEVDYTKPPRIPLRVHDAAWATQYLLQSSKARGN